MLAVETLLMVSLIFVAVAFVILRFTIAFTLSEEFREIGVMKAIGIRNLKIRSLYLVKYAALSVMLFAVETVVERTSRSDRQRKNAKVMILKRWIWRKISPKTVCPRSVCRK